jgi:fucose permease
MIKVFDGAVIPPLMGIAADAIGNQNGSLFVILISIGYLIFCSFRVSETKKN